ncbi:hypothetical protein F4775DRAFT_569095 [Biscogniauxia sp. FL1348]|nr:hypothetical protein F4775DRAFT_569095 [Biscogniauxia sp. FL1348]
MKMLACCVKKHGNQDYKKMGWVREDAMSDVLYKRQDIVERSDYSEDQVRKVCAFLKVAN